MVTDARIKKRLRKKIHTTDSLQGYAVKQSREELKETHTRIASHSAYGRNGLAITANKLASHTGKEYYCVRNNEGPEIPKATNWDLPEEELDRIYIEGYKRIPEDPEIGEIGEAMLAEVLADDPW